MISFFSLIAVNRGLVLFFNVEIFFPFFETAVEGMLFFEVVEGISIIIFTFFVFGEKTSLSIFFLFFKVVGLDVVVVFFVGVMCSNTLPPSLLCKCKYLTLQ